MRVNKSINFVFIFVVFCQDTKCLYNINEYIVSLTCVDLAERRSEWGSLGVGVGEM